jgi:TrmH family RNA methyltransferase
MLSKNQIREIQALHLKKNRGHLGRFIAEGVKTVTELIFAAPEQVEQIYAIDRFLENNDDFLKGVRSKLIEVSEDELKKISLQSSPNEVLAVSKNLEERRIEFDASKDFAFYLDDIRDPGNMGTILRLSDWFGARTVFCTHDCCELYNPKVIQASMGAFLRVQVVYDELPSLIKQFAVKNIYGAVLNGKSLYEEKLQPGLIIIGNEANGIDPENLSLINYPLTIPASGSNGTESLNAAMASAIIASEFFRQRNK